MIKLRDLLEILPKYERNGSYGKKGDVKGNIEFCYTNYTKNGKNTLYFKDLTNELIEKTIVNYIDSQVSYQYRSHCDTTLYLLCEIKENE